MRSQLPCPAIKSGGHSLFPLDRAFSLLDSLYPSVSLVVLHLYAPPPVTHALPFRMASLMPKVSCLSSITPSVWMTQSDAVPPSGAASRRPSASLIHGGSHVASARFPRFLLRTVRTVRGPHSPRALIRLRTLLGCVRRVLPPLICEGYAPPGGPNPLVPSPSFLDPSSELSLPCSSVLSDGRSAPPGRPGNQD